MNKKVAAEIESLQVQQKLELDKIAANKASASSSTAAQPSSSSLGSSGTWQAETPVKKAPFKFFHLIIISILFLLIGSYLAKSVTIQSQES